MSCFMVLDVSTDLIDARAAIFGVISFRKKMLGWQIINLIFWLIVLTALYLNYRKRWLGWCLLVAVSIDLLVFSIASLSLPDNRHIAAFALLQVIFIVSITCRPAILNSFAPRIHLKHLLFAVLLALFFGGMFLEVPEREY